MDSNDRTNSNKDVQEWLALKNINTQLYDSIVLLTDEPSTHQLIELAKSARKKYNDYCESKLASANEVVGSDFDRLFNDYQARLNALLLDKHQTMSSLSGTLTMKVQNITKGVIFFTLSPFILIAMLALLTYILLRYFFFKGKTYY
jgi:hypothetical protein